MAGDNPTNVLPNPNAASNSHSRDPENTCRGHQEQHNTAGTDDTDLTMAKKNTNHRDLLALQLAVISGFLESVRSTQASCLSLCNTCRDSVPVQRLKISPGVPNSLLSTVYPGLAHHARTDVSSRVFPHRSALNVHWTFGDSGRNIRFWGLYKKKNWHAETLQSGIAAGSHVYMSEVRWPLGTREIALFSFDRAIDAVTWPPGLERLWFGQPTGASLTTDRIPDIFNMPLDGVSFPGGLREIFFGDNFSEPIGNMVWPGGLERLSLPGFNQSIREAQWPPGLKSLEFVSPSKIRLWSEGGTDLDFKSGLKLVLHQFTQGQGRFNQPLGTTLPLSLESLWLSRAFDQPLDSVAWPSELVTLGLGLDLFCYLFGDSITWPSSLHDLFVVSKPLWAMRCPQGSKINELMEFDFDWEDY